MTDPSALAPAVAAAPTLENHGSSRSESAAAARATEFPGHEIDDIRNARQAQTAIFRKAITQTPDFPKPGILFEDILPIFTIPSCHEALIKAFELQIAEICGNTKPDVIVGLDARGFLFGPTIALRLGCSFVPVRKQGKLPGQVETASFEKEYGTDIFAMQSGAIKPGQRTIIVDDLIATGGSASAAGTLVKKNGGVLLAFIFIIELTFLGGRSKLDAPVHTLIESQA